MLLKLLLPPYNRIIEGGVIIKWHKAEGQRIDYGDDLFDLGVPEAIMTDPELAGLANYLRRMTHHLEKLTREGPDHFREEIQAKAFRRQAVFSLRVCSSDLGNLRLIRARSGAYCRVGDLVALLTTEDNEPMAEGEQALGKAGVFRVVANLI